MDENTESSALPAAGLYPDAQGASRWWDGTQWTEQMQDDAQPAATAVAPTAPTSTRGGEPFYKKKWFVGVVAGFIGIGIGIGAVGASSAAVEDTPEYKAIASDLKDATSENESLTDELAPMQDAVDEIDARAAALDDTEADLVDREKSVKTDAKAVAKREKKVGIVEKDNEAKTISGEGMYEVGEDIKAGTYKTKGSSGCYYAVLNSTDNFDIATNGNIDGPGAATVSNGQYFSLSGCGDWVRQ